jgi:hypothetical protein
VQGVIDRRFLQLCGLRCSATSFCLGRKLMKPIGELNRSPVPVLYWVLFRGSGGLLQNASRNWETNCQE